MSDEETATFSGSALLTTGHEFEGYRVSGVQHWGGRTVGYHAVEMSTGRASLRVIHRTGLVHRGVCPANILIRHGDGSPILLGFHTPFAGGADAEDVLVFDGYSPVEQYACDGKLGPWSDIYALGATLYRCVTGERPVPAPDRIMAAGRGEPDPLVPARRRAQGGFPAWILSAVDEALQLDDAQRPRDIDEFEDLLKPLRGILDPTERR